MANCAIVLARTASTALSLGGFNADATRPRRAEVYDIMLGSEAAAADNPFLYLLQRYTAPGTSTAVTPVMIDPADVATELDAGQNHTVDSTYTAGAVLLRAAINQRASWRWQAVRDDCRLMYPATASNGLGISTPVASAVLISGTIHICER